MATGDFDWDRQREVFEAARRRLLEILRDTPERVWQPGELTRAATSPDVSGTVMSLALAALVQDGELAVDRDLTVRLAVVKADQSESAPASPGQGRTPRDVIAEACERLLPPAQLTGSLEATSRARREGWEEGVRELSEALAELLSSSAEETPRETVARLIFQAHGGADWPNTTPQARDEYLRYAHEALSPDEAERGGLAGPARPAERASMSTERVGMQVAPEAVAALRDLLFDPAMRGVGYSEFVLRAVRVARAELAAPPAAARDEGSEEAPAREEWQVVGYDRDSTVPEVLWPQSGVPCPAEAEARRWLNEDAPREYDPPLDRIVVQCRIVTETEWVDVPAREEGGDAQ